MSKDSPDKRYFQHRFVTNISSAYPGGGINARGVLNPRSLAAFAGYPNLHMARRTLDYLSGTPYSSSDSLKLPSQPFFRHLGSHLPVRNQRAVIFPLGLG